MNHPYFLKKQEYFDLIVYRFQKNQTKYCIYLNEKDREMPLTYTGEVHEKWLQQFIKEVNEDYFSINRIRMLTDNQRRSLKNIIWTFTLGDKQKKEFLRDYKEQENDPFFKGEMVLKIDHLDYLMELEPLLKKEGYQLIILKKDTFIYFEII